MTQLPLWAVYTVAFGTPSCALLGVLLTLWLTRRTAREADVRSGREELMRNLRWAAEMAADPDETRRRVGIDQLVVWGRSDLLEDGDQTFVDAALASVVHERRSEVREIEALDLQIRAVEELDVEDTAYHRERGTGESED